MEEGPRFSTAGYGRHGSQWVKMAESFENLDNILHDWDKDKYKNVSSTL